MVIENRSFGRKAFILYFKCCLEINENCEFPKGNEFQVETKCSATITSDFTPKIEPAAGIHSQFPK